MPNKVYTATEQPIYFQSGSGDRSGGYINPDYVVGFSTFGLPSSSGHISHPRDLGDGSRANLFRWKAWMMVDDNALVGKAVDVYWCGFDRTTEVAGGFASGDYMFGSTDKFRNLKYLGPIFCDQQASGVVFVRGGETRLYERFGSVVFINRTGFNLAGAAMSGHFGFVLTPSPDEIQ
jgi:hypothetical protein